jgi:integrase
MADEFTDKLVESLEKPATGNRVYYDKLVKGFGVRITSAGARAFILNYRIDGRERRITIGSYPDWKVKAARDHAKLLKRQIDVGEDPMQAREDARQAKTVGQLCDAFLEECVPKRRPKTQTDYKAMIRLYLKPWWGNLKAAALTQGDVVARHRELAKRAPTRANRMLALTATIYNYAGLENPTKGVEREQEERRERFLSVVEIARVADALAAHPEKSSANAIRLLLLTGARRGETLSAEWGEFDLEAGIWTKPSSHTKQKKLHKIPLSPPALEILGEMKSAADAMNVRRIKEKKPPLKHLFPGKDGHPITDIKHSWATICEKARLGEYVQARDKAADHGVCAECAAS